MGLYIGVDGVARNVKSIYVGVGGVARKVATVYIGVNGIARQFYSSGLPLSDLPEGSLVAINEKGSIDHDYVTSKLGSRPCFTLPSDATVNPTQNADGSYTLTI